VAFALVSVSAGVVTISLRLVVLRMIRWLALPARTVKGHRNLAVDTDALKHDAPVSLQSAVLEVSRSRVESYVPAAQRRGAQRGMAVLLVEQFAARAALAVSDEAIVLAGGRMTFSGRAGWPPCQASCARPSSAVSSPPATTSVGRYVGDLAGHGVW
jgi:hypothetical protein